MAKNAGVDRNRIQLDFTPEAMERLDEIKNLAGAKTNAELLRNALKVYEWFLMKKNEQYTLQLAKDHEVREVELLL